MEIRHYMWCCYNLNNIVYFCLLNNIYILGYEAQFPIVRHYHLDAIYTLHEM